MRAAPLIVIALLVPLAPVTMADGLFPYRVTFSSAPGLVAAGVAHDYRGLVDYDTGVHTVPAPDAPVALYDGDVLVAHGITNILAQFDLRGALSGRGVHHVHVVAGDATSPTRDVNVAVAPIPTIDVTFPRWDTAHVSWSWDDGGAPVQYPEVYAGAVGSDWWAWQYLSNGLQWSSRDIHVPHDALWFFSVNVENSVGLSGYTAVRATTPAVPPADAGTGAILRFEQCYPGSYCINSVGRNENVTFDYSQSGRDLLPVLQGTASAVGVPAPGRTVDVTVTQRIVDNGTLLSERTVQASTSAAADGTWTLTLPALRAEYPGTYNIRQATYDATIAIDGVILTDHIDKLLVGPGIYETPGGGGGGDPCPECYGGSD